MNIIELRKYFYNSKEFVIRLRDDKDIVYFNGIRALNINHQKEETYECIPNIYCLNKSFLTSKIVQNDLKNKKYEDAMYFQNFLELRKSLIEDKFLEITKKPKITIIRENHRHENSLIDEKRVFLELLQELEANNLNSFLELTLNKEFVLEDLSHVSYEDIENLKQQLSNIFALECNVFYTKRHWKTLKKEKKNYKAVIKKVMHNIENYEQIKNAHNLEIVKAHFKLIKKTEMNNCQDTYIDLADFNKNNNAKALFKKWQNNYYFKDTIDILLNNNTPLDKLQLIELLVLKHWILDEDGNYIDTTKIHRRKPQASIIQCTQNLVSDLSESKLEELLIKIKKGINHYETFKYESEKNYQHQFMLDEKVVNKLKKALNISDFLYPFEEEYYTSPNEDEDILDDGKLGRIDNVFLNIHENNNIDVYLIELKYNEQALGGTNGLHTHLNDVKKLFTSDYKNFEDKLTKIINNHFKIVRSFTKNTKLPESINKILRYHFLIVIGYEKEKKDIITKILNTYNNEDYYKNYEEYQEEIPRPKMKNAKLTTLSRLCQEIPNEKCDVQMFLEEVHKNNDKIQITDKELEKYEL